MTKKMTQNSPGSDGVRESMAELKSYVDRGMTIEDIVAYYRKHHPDRVRTVKRVSATDPGEHTPASIKQMRLKLEISQALFAQMLGVSTVLVQGWEQGVREPSTLARRLLDFVKRDPPAWLASVTVPPAGKSRRAG